MFFIPTSTYDSRNTVHSTIEGDPTFEFQTSLGSVSIINRSTRDLYINDIETRNQTGQIGQNISASARDTSGWNPTITTTIGSTPIVIKNINVIDGEVRLRGIIDNDAGTAEILSAGGDIRADSGARIDVTSLEVSAPRGAIGTTGAIRIDTDLIAADALGDISLEEIDGPLNVDTVVSDAGTVSLTAAGSIEDANVDDLINLSGLSLVLVSNTGSIGTTTNVLDVDVTGTGAAFNATADGDVVVTERDGALYVGNVTSRNGDVVLRVPDLRLSTGEGRRRARSR